MGPPSPSRSVVRGVRWCFPATRSLSAAAAQSHASTITAHVALSPHGRKPAPVREEAQATAPCHPNSSLPRGKGTQARCRGQMEGQGCSPLGWSWARGRCLFSWQQVTAQTEVFLTTSVVSSEDRARGGF